jgi:hypothetical protein
MKRILLAAATTVALAAGAIGFSSPADASVHFSIGFGYPGPFYGPGYYPQPFYAPPRPACYPVVKVRKVVYHHRVHYKRVLVTVCRPIYHQFYPW